ncbi:type IV pilin-like G/H family protein [Brasilonema octagenarum]|uniref:Pesticin n=1 Tax=Brasilonema octagenarum UFV-OR1 TaxID=417115 RepID=A0ABX1MCE3_9CYAN|nr:type IV pilin-like G/H family protein [Brasilonema octagenarum]NMF66289.1 pesticin [Brasilonema octagenarum UFV-OR1]
MMFKIKAKLLHYVIKKKKEDEGFTLIELLVVIIIISILSAIALPSFLSQANKAKQSEAKTYVGSINRAQQAYYLENGQFADISELGIGIKDTQKNYKYERKVNSNNQVVVNNGISRKDGLKSYAGVVIFSKQQGATLAILCESNNIGIGTAQEPNSTTNENSSEPQCPDNYTELNK